MTLPELRSSLWIVVATLTAAFAAGVLIAAEWIVFFILASLIDGQIGGVGWQLAVIAGVVGAVAFAVGLAFPGAFVWAWLHGNGNRSYRSAAIAGSIGAYCGTALISLSAGWIAFLFGLWAVIPGGAAGLIIRSLAYRSLTPPPAPPA